MNTRSIGALTRQRKTDQMITSRIVAVHLLNDFSGTSFVFSQALEALQNEENEVHVFTANPAGKGFLHEVTGAFVHTVYYRSSVNRLLMAMCFLYSQLYIFIRLLFFVRRSDLLYVNTIQPFGAALAAWVRGCRIVYHVHKVTQKPGILKHWLLLVVRMTATKCIYVSKYLRANSPLRTKSQVIYNSLPEKFISQAKSYNSPAGQPFRVLMLCSLKKAKGIFQYIECANRLPQLHFDLVLGGTQAAIDRFFKGYHLPKNMSVFPVQKNVHAFYASASLVVNLSVPGEFTESFGMTILEAMYYKKPVIVPPVGGITELVTHGVQGYQVDSRNAKTLVHRIKQLSENDEMYQTMSEAAFRKACCFRSENFSHEIVKIFNFTWFPAPQIAGKGFRIQFDQN